MTTRRPALGQLIRDRREQLGLSQRELAERAGLKTRITVGNAEAGRDVKDWVLRRLDHALGWRARSSERYLADGAVPEIETPAEERFTDPTEADIWAIGELSKERRREIIGELRAARARLRSREGGADESPPGESCAQ